MRLRYLYVDRRLADELPHYGSYFIEGEAILLSEITRHLDALPEGSQVMLKLSIPATAGLYTPLTAHPKVLRAAAEVVAQLDVDVAQAGRDRPHVARHREAQAEALKLFTVDEITIRTIR